MSGVDWDWVELRREFDDLPSHPAVASRLIPIMSGDHEVSRPELEELILQDPALSLSLVRLANTPIFRQTGRIGSVAHALVLVDRPYLRIASLNLTLSPRCDSLAEFSHREFWRHCWLRSNLAHWLALRYSKADPEVVRFLGLTIDLGRLMLAEREARQSAGLTAGPKIPNDAIPSITAKAWTDWRFPDHLIEAVHQFPQDISVPGPLSEVGLVSLADHLARCPADSLDRDAVDPDVARQADLLEIDWASLAAAFETWRRSAEELFAPSPVSVELLQAEARRALFQASLLHAHELTQSTRQAEEDKRRAEELMKQHDRLQQQVTLDPLLGIGNRRHFDNRLAEEFKRCRRNGQPLSLILFDLDEFKKLNDTYLHLAGDAVLRAVTQSMAACLRSSDVFARYGGEEFGVICPETDPTGAVRLAERMRQCLEGLDVPFREHTLRITASFGVATVVDSDSVTSVESIIESADQCLYQAKRLGRNQVRDTHCPQVVGREPLAAELFGGDTPGRL